VALQVRQERPQLGVIGESPARDRVEQRARGVLVEQIGVKVREY